MAKKYQQSPVPQEKREVVELGPARLSPDKRVKIFDDGTLEAENIVERDSKELSLNFTQKGEKYYFSKNLDENTSEEYVPHNITRQYRTKVSRNFEIKKAFAIYEGDVRKLVTKELDRYKSLRKDHKKKVDAILKTKNNYIFTTDRYGNPWAQAYIDSTQFGPYNYDTKLVVSRDIDFINDLIVIRTGSNHMLYDKTANKFVTSPSGNQIVWVSPHEVLNYSGAGNFILSGGASLMQAVHARTGSYQSGNIYYERKYNIVSNTGVYSVSSRFIKILADEQLKTEQGYQLINSNGEEVRVQNWTLDGSVFYYTFNEYNQNILTGTWDGTIPSGAMFTIESWSTNPKYIGFDGEISVVPVDDSVATDIDLSLTVEGQGVSTDYQASIRKAVKQAKSKFHKKLNKILIKKGYKYKNRKMIRYEKMLERVAQNVYDGLGVVRNDQISKLQMAAVDPADSPIYYDGTSQIYGGSLESSSYDALYTTIARTNLSTMATNTTTTTSSSSTTSSSGGTGGSSY